jgi:hypothetical protein
MITERICLSRHRQPCHAASGVTGTPIGSALFAGDLCQTAVLQLHDLRDPDVVPRNEAGRLF